MRRIFYLFAGVIAVALVAIVLTTHPGCHPESPGARRGKEEAGRGDSIRAAVEAEYRLVVDRLRADSARQAEAFIRANERSAEATESARAATERADRLLATLAGIEASAPDSERLAACLPALDACTESRREQQRVIEAQRVELAAVQDLLSTTSEQLAAERRRAEGLATAAERYREAFEAMERAYDSERSRYLREKRRRLATQVAAVAAVTGMVLLTQR